MNVSRITILVVSQPDASGNSYRIILFLDICQVVLNKIKQIA
jgi:hypothetical protein